MLINQQEQFKPNRTSPSGFHDYYIDGVILLAGRDGGGSRRPVSQHTGLSFTPVLHCSGAVQKPVSLGFKKLNGDRGGVDGKG